MSKIEMQSLSLILQLYDEQENIIKVRVYTHIYIIMKNNKNQPFLFSIKNKYIFSHLLI